MRRRSLVLLGIVMMLAGRSATLQAYEPAVAPKLDDIDRPSTSPAPDGPGAAKALPGTVTICQDVSTRRCWTEAGATECATETGTSAKMFRRTGSNADPGKALQDCWSALDR